MQNNVGVVQPGQGFALRHSLAWTEIGTSGQEKRWKREIEWQRWPFGIIKVEQEVTTLDRQLHLIFCVQRLAKIERDR